MPAPYPFAGGGPALAFWAVYAVAFAPDAVRALRRDDPDPGTVRDAGSRYVLAACLGAGLLCAFLAARAVPAAAVSTARPAVFAVGLCVALSGAALRRVAVRTLGDAFTVTVAVADDQRVVEAGPYRWVRHPSYTGAMATFLGLGLALTNWLSLLAVALSVAVGYGYRVRVEERALRAELGDAYAAYAERTPYRLLPYVY